MGGYFYYQRTIRRASEVIHTALIFPAAPLTPQSQIVQFAPNEANGVALQLAYRAAAFPMDAAALVEVVKLAQADQEPAVSKSALPLLQTLATYMPFLLHDEVLQQELVEVASDIDNPHNADGEFGAQNIKMPFTCTVLSAVVLAFEILGESCLQLNEH